MDMDSLMQQTLRTSVLWIPHVLILPVSLVCLDVCVSLRPSGFACLILGSVWQGELWYYAEFNNCRTFSNLVIYQGSGRGAASATYAARWFAQRWGGNEGGRAAQRACCDIYTTLFKYMCSNVFESRTTPRWFFCSQLRPSVRASVVIRAAHTTHHSLTVQEDTAHNAAHARESSASRLKFHQRARHLLFRARLIY